jgi:hypothetical protein
MFSLSKVFTFLKELLLTDELTENELAQFTKHIHQICDSVQERNLTLVSNHVENTSGNNNYQLVLAGVSFVKKSVGEFNTNHANDCTKEDYLNEFITYIYKVERDFDKKNYDPDGAGYGTITDISNKIKNSQFNEI